MSMKDTAGLQLAVHWIQQALITTYEGTNRVCSQCEGEPMDLLFATHFRNSDVGKEGAVPAAARWAMGVDWWVAARIITHRRVERPLIHSSHVNVQVWTGFSWHFYMR